MNKSFLNSILVDFDQQKNSLGKSIPQQDYVDKGNVITASGLKLYLAAVADGGGDNAPEQAAKLAVDTLFTEVRRRTERNPIDVLRNALLAANQLVYQQTRGKDYVGLTVIAVKDDQLYYAQVGKMTRAYFVNNNQKVTLLPSQSELHSDRCLGDEPEDPGIVVGAYSGAIKQGERVILCSDGLFEPPKDLHGEITKKVADEIPLIGQYDDIRGSARHLSSIAKGMDSSDDITVMVLGFGRKPKGLSPIVLAIVGGVAVLSILIIFAFLRAPKPLPPQDVGAVFLLKGAVLDTSKNPSQSYGDLATINNEETINVSDGPADLQLEPDVRTNNQPIVGINLYLSKTTTLNLTRINLNSVDPQGQPTDPSLLNQSQFTLLSGRLLIVSDGSRGFVVIAPIQNEKNNIQVILNPGGPGILGVKNEGGILEIDCIQGNCQLTMPNTQPQMLLSPGKSLFDLNGGSLASQDQPLVDLDKNDWHKLCQGAQLPGPTQLSNCAMLPQPTK